MNNKDRRFDEIINYLFILQESGVINMFGAPRVLMRRFGLNRGEAEHVTSYWMANWEALNEEFNGGTA